MRILHNIFGKISFFLLLGALFLLSFPAFAETQEQGIIQVEYTSEQTGERVSTVFEGSDSIFINPQLSTDIYVLGLTNSTVEIFDGENKIAEAVIEEGDSFTVGNNSFVGKKISLPLASGTHTLSSKVFLSGHVLYKEYSGVSLVVDTIAPVVSVANHSRWEGNSTWVRNELSQLYASVSDSGSGINTDISSVGYDLWDITDNTSIAKSGDSLSFSGGKFFLTPEGGFTTGTFTNGHKYRFTFLVKDKAGNENTASQEFTVDYTNVVYGEDNALFSGGNKGDVHILGIYDPANPECATNSQCKEGGDLPGYMPYVSHMKVYTNPTHFAFWVDKTKVSKRNEGGGVIMFDANLHGSGWNNKGGRYLYEGGNVEWIDNERGIFKTINFVKSEGVNQEYLRFRDSAANLLGKWFYYDMIAGGKPVQAKLNAFSPTRYNLETGFVVPDISGTVGLSTEAQTVWVEVSGLGKIGEVVVPAGETTFSFPNTTNKEFKKDTNFSTQFNTHVQNSYGRTDFYSAKSVVVDGVRPEIVDLDFSDNHVFTADENIVLDFSAKDSPFHTAMVGTFSLDYANSTVLIKNRDTDEVVKTGVVSSWKNNNNGTYNFLENFDSLPDGKYSLTIHLVDKFGNANESDTIRNFVVDSSAPIISPQVKDKGAFENGMEIFSTTALEFSIADVSSLDFNPEKTFLKFSKKINGVWEVISVNGFKTKQEDGKTFFYANTTIGEEGEMKYEIQVADTAGNISEVQTGNFFISPRSFDFESNDLFFSTDEIRNISSLSLQVGDYFVKGTAPVRCKVTQGSQLETIVVDGVVCQKDSWNIVSGGYDFSLAKSKLSLDVSLTGEADGTGEVLISIDNGLGLVGRLRVIRSRITFEKSLPLNLSADGETVGTLDTSPIQGFVTKSESLLDELNFPTGTEITDTFWYDTKEYFNILIPNPKFTQFTGTPDDGVEDNITSWGNLSMDAYIVFDETRNKNVVKIKPDGGSNPHLGGANVSLPEKVGGKTYKISGWAKADSNTGIQIAMQGGNGSGFGWFGHSIALTSEWKYFEFESTFPEENETKTMRAVLYGNSSTFVYYDDIEIQEVQNGDWRTDATKSWYIEAKDDVTDGICDWKTGDGDGDPRNGADDRCGKSEFPEKALIVSTKDNVYIFDGETTEMWMRFDESGYNVIGDGCGVGGCSHPSVFAINGVLYIANYRDQGLGVANFKTDSGSRYRKNGYSRVLGGKLNTRNVSNIDWRDTDFNTQIISNAVNDISARVINGKTYVAVATDGGISVINETDGTVVNDTFKTRLNTVFISSDGWVYAQHYGGHDVVRKMKVDGTEESEVQRFYSVDGNRILDFVNRKNSFGSAGMGKIFLSSAHQEFPRITQFFEDSQKYITKDFATLPLYGKTLGHWTNSLEDRSGKGNTLHERKTKILIIGNYNNIVSAQSQFESLGYDVIKNTDITTLAEINTINPDIVADFGGWSYPRKTQLIEEAYHAGYSVLTEGNDSNSVRLYPIATSVHTSVQAGTIVPEGGHEITEGWSSTPGSGGDGRHVPLTLKDGAIILAKDETNGFIESFILEEEGKGKWFHYQPKSLPDSVFLKNAMDYMRMPKSSPVQISPVANGAELQAFNFDGTNYLESDSTDFNITGSLTVGAWVKFATTEGDQKIISKTESGGFQLAINSPHSGENKLHFLVHNGNNYRSASIESSFFVSNQWYFVQGKFNSTTQKISLYINGEKKSEADFGSSTITSTSVPLIWGAEPNGGNREHRLKGSIALPFVSSEAYTDEQIKNLYDQSKNWFAENSKITLQGNSDVVKDIACAPTSTGSVSDICFVATDDGVITELNTQTGLTQKSEKTGTQITLDSDGNILGTSGENSGKFSFAEEKTLITKTLANLPENTDFTVTLPAGLTLKDAENNHIKTDAQGKLTFELQAEKTSQDLEKTVSFFSTENPDLKGEFPVKIWGVQGESEIISGTSNGNDFVSGEKILDPTPEFSVKISGRYDDVSKNIKPVLQISKTADFSAENIVLEKISDGFVTLSTQEKVLNEGFENGFDGWGSGWSSSKETEFSIVHSGNSSGKFALTQEPNKWAGPTRSGVTVEKNTDYTASAWVYIPSDQDDVFDVSLAIHRSDSWNNEVGSKKGDILKTNEWQKIDYDFNSGNLSEIRMSVILWSHTKDEYFYVDDIQIIKSAELEKNEHELSQTISLLDSEYLEENIPYFARVKSLDEAGRVSNWSDVFSFTKEKDFAPRAPSDFSLYEGGTDISIPNKGSTTAGTVDVDFLLRDDNVDQKLKYQLQISTLESFATIFQDIKGTDFVLAGKQKVSIPFLSPGQTYFVRVRGIDDGENIGGWTIPLSFSTEIKPPENLFIQALEDVNDPDSAKRYVGDDITFADRNPLFGFTLPSTESLPIFLSRSISGSGVILYNELSYEDGGFTQSQQKTVFSGNTAKISETALSGAFKIGEQGYIYLNQDTAPAAYKSFLPADFVSAKNDTKGHFSGRAWSNVLGWLEFSSGNISSNTCETPDYFDASNFSSCVDIYGKFQGYVRIPHPVFLESALKSYFGDTWSDAQQYFVNGEHYTKRIFRPTVTAETLSALPDESAIKDKLQTLWQKEGGYVKFSDEKVLALPEELFTQWKPDGLQKRLDIKAGIQNGSIPKIEVNVLNAFEGFENPDFTRNFSLVALSGTRWEPLNRMQFDISADENAAEQMKQFLKNIPEGGIVLLTTGKNPSLGRDVWKNELLEFGATESLLDSFTENDSYIFVGRKGKSFPLYEDFADEKNTVYSQVRAGASSVGENGGKNNLYYGGDTAGFVQTQNLGTLIFYDEANAISSDITGTEDLETATPENAGIIGTAFSTAAGKIYFDADGIHGATNNLTPTSDDYGVVIQSVDTQGNVYFSGRAWGDGIGFIKMSRGEIADTCETVDTPGDQFGVCRDKNGAFHGYGWSPSFGWVSFENVYAHDPFSSSGYDFVLQGPGGKTYEYSPRNITTGEIKLPLLEIQAHLKKDCEKDSSSCLLPYGAYKWKVQSTIEDLASGFTNEESFLLSPLDPEITHQCLETIPLQTSFAFAGVDKNVPESPLNYTIDFTDLSEKSYDIDSLSQIEYSTPENGNFVSDEKDFSAFNGGRISYEITLQNQEKKESKIQCENVLVRGMNVDLVSPVGGVLVASNDPFVFDVETSAGDVYDYTLEFQRNDGNQSEDDFVWSADANDTVLTHTGSHTLEAEETQYRQSEEVSGLEIDTHYCWRVIAQSQDGTQKTSDVSCFSTQNARPVISDVAVYGNDTLIELATADTTPSFEFTVTDDSSELTATITITDDEGNVITSFSATQQTDDTGEAHFVMTLPDDQALEDFGKKYTYTISVQDSGGEEADPFSDDFILIASSSDAVGYGNIGTPNIDFNPADERTNHRFAYDTENNIGMIDFNPLSGGVHIAPEKVYGYAFNAQTGWIRFNCSKNPTNVSDISYVYTNSITEINDSDDSYCLNSGDRYGVVPGVLNGSGNSFSKNIGALRGSGANKTQDLLGKAKFEIFGKDAVKKTEFLYFDIATYREDFPNDANFNADNWKNNEHGAKAVGINEKGKLSGYAWSPAFGWISMGRTTAPETNGSQYYPITEYIPAEANCRPEALFSSATFLANETRVIPLANACSGKEIDSSSRLYWIREGEDESNPNTFSFGSGTDTASFTLSPLDAKKAGVTYLVWGNVLETSGAELNIPFDEAIKIKIIADPHPDFEMSDFEIVNASGNGAFANGKDINTFTFQLKDRFGNPIFEDTDVGGMQAKEVTVSFAFKDEIRLNQIANSAKGGAVSIAGAGIDTILKNGILKRTSSFPVKENTNPTYSFSSYAPTGGEDQFNIDSVKITIKDLRANNESTIFDKKEFKRDEASNTITLGENEDTIVKSTSVFFQKIFSGESVFTNEIFDENSDDLNAYTVSLRQLFSENANQLDETTPFHFMHCLDADPESGVLEFSPLKYKTASSAESGENCYEISSEGQGSQLSNPKNGRTLNDNSVNYTDSTETPPHASGGETAPGVRSYLFETKASRIDGSLDIPDVISTHLYVAFKNTFGEWIKYEIPDLSIQELHFIMRTGYIEGVAHGNFVYESEVTNKEDGVFSQVGSIKKIEKLRNALTKNLAQYIAEDGGRQSTDLITEKVELSSAHVSGWLQGEETAINNIKGQNSSKIKVLDGGNMLWIRGEGDSFSVTLGDGVAIDDLGIGESKTLVVEGGNLDINADIFRRGEGTLALIVLRHPDQLYKSSEWDNSGNILIDHYVKNIRAMMYADGSVLSHGKLTVDANKTVYDGYDSDLVRKNLANQLYILGSVSSLNTYGGSASPRKTDEDGVYINTLSNRNVWHNTLFDKTDTSLENLRSESIRFDLKRLREFRPKKTYLDDVDKDGIRDSIDGGDAKMQVCIDAKNAHATLPDYCVPQNGTYAGENSAAPSFTDSSASWDDKLSDIKAQTSVIFEYDEQIKENPAPGTVIFSDLALD